MKKVKVPPGTQCHTKMRLKVSEFPVFRQRDVENEYVKVIVKVRSASGRRPKLIEELSKEGI